MIILRGGRKLGNVDEGRRGLIFGVLAYTTWGILPVYWPLLEPAGSVEILAHRIIWSLVFVAVLLAIRPRPGWWSRLREQPRSMLYLALAGGSIAINWGTYIWAVTHGHVVESALGYYINPLVLVLAGVVVLRERLNGTQWSAVGIAGVAVAILTVDYGRPPWVALALAASFTVYALCKKQASAGALESLAVETGVLFPLALAYLGWLELTGTAAFGHAGWGNALLLASAGVATGVPLLFFAAAATRVSMTALGIMQYIAPTLHFLLGILVFAEPMPPARWAGFCLVWLALAVFTYDGFRRRRRLLALRENGPAPTTPGVSVEKSAGARRP